MKGLETEMESTMLLWIIRAVKKDLNRAIGIPSDFPSAMSRSVLFLVQSIQKIQTFL